jgi:hypothetical protein
MASTDLILGDRRFSVPHTSLFLCDLFHRDQSLLLRPYVVRSSVSPSVFEHFLLALDGAKISVTKENRNGLGELSTEFGFIPLSVQLLAFDGANVTPSEVYCLLRSLQEHQVSQSRDLAEVRNTAKALSRQCETLAGIRRDVDRLSAETVGRGEGCANGRKEK